MRLLLVFVLFVCPEYIFSQISGPVRYLSDNFFSSNQIEIVEDLVYGKATNFKGKKIDLLLDVYFPKERFDPEKAPPLVVLLPAGGFIRSRKSSLRNRGMHFARCGYVTACIQYRSGWYEGKPNARCEGSPEAFLQAVYRAVSDANAALRYLADSRNWEAFRPLDPQSIFLLGGSAGAVTALNATFMNQADFDQYDPNLSATCGRMDTSGNQFSAEYQILGISNSGGGVLDPDFISADKAVPVTSFHGRNDKISPYRKGPVMDCPEPNPFLVLHGSHSVSKRLKDLGVCFELTVDIQGEHKTGLDRSDKLRWTKAFFFKVLEQNCQGFLLRIMKGPEQIQTFYSSDKQ